MSAHCQELSVIMPLLKEASIHAPLAFLVSSPRIVTIVVLRFMIKRRENHHPASTRFLSPRIRRQMSSFGNYYGYFNVIYSIIF